MAKPLFILPYMGAEIGAQKNDSLTTRHVYAPEITVSDEQFFDVLRFKRKMTQICCAAYISICTYLYIR